jgi:hypothetical protein
MVKKPFTGSPPLKPAYIAVGRLSRAKGRGLVMG